MPSLFSKLPSITWSHSEDDPTRPSSSSSQTPGLSWSFSYDTEKGINRASGGAGSYSASGTDSGASDGLSGIPMSFLRRFRTRRTHLLAAIAFVSVLGIWVYRSEQLEIWQQDSAALYDSALTPAYGGYETHTTAIVPGIIIGSGGKHFGDKFATNDDPEIALEAGAEAAADTELEAEPEPEPDLALGKEDVEGGVDAEGSSEADRGDEEVAESSSQHRSAHKMPTDPVQRWGIQMPMSEHILAGLSPWPENAVPGPEDEPFSSLGHFADNIYNAGPRSLPQYRVMLREFIEVAFPAKLRPQLRDGLKRYLGDDGEGESWLTAKNIWQTDKAGEMRESSFVQSWRQGHAQGEGWEWSLMTDNDANNYIKRLFSQPLGKNHLHNLWDSLPTGILRSDTLRYLVLLLEGGIYSDTDTRLLKAPSRWGHGARLWKNGEGWLEDEARQRIAAGEDVDAVLGPPSVVVGVEADVGTREDWYSWWPRPIQIAQWTMAAAPNHPITLSAMLRIMHSTAKAADWAKHRWWDVKNLRSLGQWDEADKLLQVTVLKEPNDGGPVGIMDWTGPGVWTDATLSYLRVRYGMKWVDLRELRVPLRVGDVVILPVTGFSPGVGNFGSQGPGDDQAMVQHMFRGSWKGAF